MKITKIVRKSKTVELAELLRTLHGMYSFAAAVEADTSRPVEWKYRQLVQYVQDEARFAFQRHAPQIPNPAEDRSQVEGTFRWAIAQMDAGNAVRHKSWGKWDFALRHAGDYFQVSPNSGLEALRLDGYADGYEDEWKVVQVPSVDPEAANAVREPSPNGGVWGLLARLF